MRVVIGGGEFKAHCKKHESVISTAATMRVLNILRHWVSKHAQVSCCCAPTTLPEICQLADSLTVKTDADMCLALLVAYSNSTVVYQY